jgi:hypothetical protein
MGHILLWIESLALSLLLVAVWVARVTQLSPRQIFWKFRVPALALLWMGTAVILVVGTDYHFRQEGTFTYLWRLLLLLAVIGETALLRWQSPLSLRAILSFLFGVTVPVIASGLTWLEPSLPMLAVVGILSAILAWWISFGERTARLMIVILFAIVLLVVFAGLTAIVPQLYFAHLVPSVLFSSLVTLTVAYALGAVALLICGLRYPSGQSMVVAVRWPRYKLAVICLGVCAAEAATLWGLGHAAKQQADVLENEASILALAAAPARIADRENAAVVYEQAVAQLHPWPLPDMPGVGGPGMGMQGMGSPPPPPSCQEKWTQWRATGKLGFEMSDPELRRFLKRQSPALTLLRKGAANLDASSTATMRDQAWVCS